jgi:HD-GYP domain-containing protein (c-di-GMP phosphodiesterase class II)
LLVAAALATVTILAGAIRASGERALETDLDRGLGEQLELAAEFIREHGRELANRASGRYPEPVTSGLASRDRASRRITAFSHLHLMAALRPDGTMVAISSHLGPTDLRLFREAIRPVVVEAAATGSGHDPYTLVALPSGLFLAGFHLPHGGKRGLLLGVFLTEEVLEHFRALSSVDIGIFGRGQRARVSPFQIPVERCGECHDRQQNTLDPPPTFTVRRSFKSETFFTRSLPDGFRYGFMGLKMGGRAIAMLVARKPKPPAGSAWTDPFAVSSAPAAGLVLAMLAVAGGLLVLGRLRSRGLPLPPSARAGREGPSAATVSRDPADALVQSFSGVVEGVAGSKEEMDRLHRQLRAIVEAQSQEAAEAERRLAGLLEASQAFGQDIARDDLGELMLRRAAELTRARWGRLALLEEGEDGYRIFDLTPAGRIVRLEGGVELDVVSRRVIQSAKPQVVRAGEAVASFASISGEGRHSGFMIAAPLLSGAKVVGAITLCERMGEDFTPQDADTLALLANQAALAFHHATLYKGTQQGYLQTIFSLVNAIEAKDWYLRGHSGRVTAYATAIAHRLALDAERVDKIRLAAELHDVGKVGVDLGVLNKKGPLNAKELAQIRRHPEVGQKIVRPLASFKEIGTAILQHHEWFDGGGYPGGLVGEQITLEARILAIADAFDAMTSRRPYRPRRSVQEACAELLAGAGTQFDPSLVDIAVQVLTEQGRR